MRREIVVKRDLSLLTSNMNRRKGECLLALVVVTGQRGMSVTWMLI